jgi:hypothetical protein
MTADTPVQGDGEIPTPPRYLIEAHARPSDDVHSEPSNWSVEGDDYDELMAQIHRDLPTGWELTDTTVRET